MKLVRPFCKYELDMSRALTGERFSFDGIINGISDAESWFVSNAGHIVRVVRGPCVGEERVCILERYDFDGRLKDRKQKGPEASSYFSLQYPEGMTGRRYHRLTARPGFIAKPDSYRGGVRIIPRNTPRALGQS